jgi:hypothetical protein
LHRDVSCCAEGSGLQPETPASLFSAPQIKLYLLYISEYQEQFCLNKRALLL